MIQFKKGNMGIFALDWIEDGGVQRAREGGWGDGVENCLMKYEM